VDDRVPSDPLAKEDPDVTLSVEERGVGGLGIFLTKQIMDDVAYEYREGQNILTLKKNL
jgi:anti-sigma regulatory factor (Ser/Thr protein kinase)